MNKKKNKGLKELNRKRKKQENRKDKRERKS